MAYSTAQIPEEVFNVQLGEDIWFPFGNLTVTYEDNNGVEQTTAIALTKEQCFFIDYERRIEWNATTNNVVDVAITPANDLPLALFVPRGELLTLGKGTLHSTLFFEQSGRRQALIDLVINLQ